MNAIQDWYYTTSEREQVGPISSEELQDLVKKKIVMRSTLVWTSALENWVRASKVGKLFTEENLLGKKETTKLSSNSDNLELKKLTLDLKSGNNSSPPPVKSEKVAESKSTKIEPTKASLKKPVPISHMIPLPNSIPQSAPVQTPQGGNPMQNSPKPIPIPTGQVPIQNPIPSRPSPVPSSQLIPPNEPIPLPTSQLLPPGSILPQPKLLATPEQSDKPAFKLNTSNSEETA